MRRMFFHLIRTFFSFLLCINLLVGQHQPVFTDLEGPPLLDALRQEYKPAFTLSYAEARDTLYGKILNFNDSLSCIYTDYTIYLDPAENPRQDAFSKGINAEHLWPRSKGANHIQSEADMHHLYACREDVNNFRGNLPFEDLTDAQTNSWYYLDIKTSQKPTTNIEKYSRLGSTSFTPPVEKKGDIARAMMYFYTMYNDLADAADPEFFEIQRATFCLWHFEDPVDDKEWQKNQQIALYQDDKLNPFILDCTLPERMYCTGMDLFCEPVVSSTVTNFQTFDFDLYPIPANRTTILSFIPENATSVEIIIYNELGQLSGYKQLNPLSSGTHTISLQDLQIADLIPGWYIFQLVGKSGGATIISGHKKIYYRG